MIELSQLLAKGIHEVLASRELSGSVMTYYRNIYTGGMPVKSCNDSIRGYFRRLQIDGIETQKKQAMAKYQLKKEVGCIRFKSQMYNSSTITDEIAEQVIKEFPKLASAFDIKEGEKTVSEKDKLLARATELEIEGAEKLSAKKLKDAIADKEIRIAEEEREDLVLQAIDKGIEGAEEMTVEQLEKALE